MWRYICFRDLRWTICLRNIVIMHYLSKLWFHNTNNYYLNKICEYQVKRTKRKVVARIQKIRSRNLVSELLTVASFFSKNTRFVLVVRAGFHALWTLLIDICAMLLSELRGLVSLPPTVRAPKPKPLCRKTIVPQHLTTKSVYGTTLLCVRDVAVVPEHENQSNTDFSRKHTTKVP